MWLSVPAYLLFFWLPLPLGAPAGAREPWAAIAGEIGQNRYLWATLGAALVATAANAVNAPNWYALVADVNPPEHRGTAFSLVALANSSGRAIGGAAAGIATRLLNGPEAGVLASPEQYATALSLFTLCFIPAGACFFAAARTAPRDIEEVTRALRHRTGIQAEEHNRP